MDKKKLIKYGASVLVLGVTVTTAIYLSKKILVKVVSKKTGKTKEELADKSVVELFKLNKTPSVAVVTDTPKEEPKVEETIKK